MKKITWAIASLSLICSTATLRAQTPTAGEMLKLSQYNFSFGTARSAALGGAFTSLGADLSSMTINPAGLGMYQSSDFGFSPSITSSSMEGRYDGYRGSDSKTKFSIGNLAGAFNVYQGSGTVTSVTLGFGYSKLADFNTSSLAYGQGIANSITEVFAERMNGVNVNVFDTKDPYQPFRQNLGLYQWGGGLAYQAKLLEPINSTQYTPFGPPIGTGALSPTATMNPNMRIFSEGSIGEYDLSGGVNIQNILYLGLTIGVQDVYMRNENNYTETYNGNAYNLTYMNYIQRTKFNGTGVNVKFGAILRPISNLRIGVAVHSPTWISMEEEYVEYMAAEYKNITPQGYIDSPVAVNNYRLSTPTRFMAGISYSQPGVGLITFDYERAWYNGMRLSGTGYRTVEEDIKYSVKELYQASNTFRAGLELTPIKNFFLRGGYASYGNCFKTTDVISMNHPDIKSFVNYSGGVGFRFGSTYLDLTYIYTDYKYLQSDLFSFSDDNYTIDSGTVDYKQNRHTVTLSVGVRF